MTDGLPNQIAQLISELSKLPTIGPKTAARLAFFLLKAPSNQILDLERSLEALRVDIVLCDICFNYSDNNPCSFCTNSDREDYTLCVVEDPLDLLAIERTGQFRGRYHVLHGAISPLEGIGPGDLKIRELVERVQTHEIHEVVVATNATFEGDATALEIVRQLESTNAIVTRLARGLATGGDIEYADSATLAQAFEGRRKF